MNPAASVIIFTVFSGFGFGLLALLGFGCSGAQGWSAFFLWGLGYGFAVVGLLASVTHLGNPQRAWRAFSQWKSSWLSREGIGALTTLFCLAPAALGAIFGLPIWSVFGPIGGLLAVMTVFTTSMIYAQLQSVPRWNHACVPLMFASFMAAGGLIVLGQLGQALMGLGLLALVLIVGFWIGDRQFPARAQTIAKATGLGHMGALRLFEAGHTSENYLMREMIYVVERKHRMKLRVIAVVLTCFVPMLLIAAGQGGDIARGLGLLVHLCGACVARWLFFAEAEHVVGLYYDQR